MASGDIVVLTAVIRDLKATYPDLEICFNGMAGEIWQHNPHISTARANRFNTRVCDQYEIGYDYKHRKHIIECLRRDLEQEMDITLQRGPNVGEIFMTPEELEHREIEEPYWVVMGGGKTDISIKWYPYYQEIIDRLKGRIKFVQCGKAGIDHHPQLKNVMNKVGQTGVRDFLSLLYHADGVLSPITFAMHAYAALPPNPERPKRGVVLCGGREDISLTYYPHNSYLHTLGQLDCCMTYGCMRSWSHKDHLDPAMNCLKVTKIGDTSYARCMTMIQPVDVIDAIQSQLTK